MVKVWWGRIAHPVMAKTQGENACAEGTPPHLAPVVDVDLHPGQVFPSVSPPWKCPPRSFPQLVLSGNTPLGLSLSPPWKRPPRSFPQLILPGNALLGLVLGISVPQKWQNSKLHSIRGP